MRRGVLTAGFVPQRHGQCRGAPEGGAGRAGAADPRPAGQDLRREGQHPEERGEDPEDGVQHHPERPEVKAPGLRPQCDNKGEARTSLLRTLTLPRRCTLNAAAPLTAGALEPWARAVCKADRVSVTPLQPESRWL